MYAVESCDDENHQGRFIVIKLQIRVFSSVSRTYNPEQLNHSFVTEACTLHDCTPLVCNEHRGILNSKEDFPYIAHPEWQDLR